MPPPRKSGDPTSIRLPDDIRKFLVREAARLEWPLTLLINQLLREAIEYRKAARK